MVADNLNHLDVLGTPILHATAVHRTDIANAIVSATVLHKS